MNTPYTHLTCADVASGGVSVSVEPTGATTSDTDVDVVDWTAGWGVGEWSLGCGSAPLVDCGCGETLLFAGGFCDPDFLNNVGTMVCTDCSNFNLSCFSFSMYIYNNRPNTTSRGSSSIFPFGYRLSLWTNCAAIILGSAMTEVLSGESSDENEWKLLRLTKWLQQAV